jgi:hypothetical protein
VGGRSHRHKEEIIERHREEDAGKKNARKKNAGSSRKMKIEERGYALPRVAQ